MSDYGLKMDEERIMRGREEGDDREEKEEKANTTK